MNRFTARPAAKTGIVRLAFGMLLALFVLAAPAKAQDEGPWLVTEAAGDAWLASPDGTKTPLRQGDEVGPGSVVGAGAGGQVTLSRGGTAMTLSPNGETEVPADSDQGARTTILQRLGTLLLKVDKRPEQHFQVDTPFLAAVVKGTTFTVSVDGQGSAVHVVEGAVEVGSFASGEVALVRPGQTAKVSAQGGGALKVSGLNAPSKAGGDPQQGQSDAAGEDGQATAEGTTEQAPAAQAGKDGNVAAGGQGAKAAAAGGPKGLTLEQSVGWDSIDIATVSDGFVAAAPTPGQQGLQRAAEAGGTGAAASSAGGANGNAVFGQSTAVGATAAVTSSAVASGGAAANSASAATSSAAASSAAASNSNGLGAVIQSTAATVAAQNHGQAVSSIVKALKGKGNNGNGNGNN